MQRGDRSGLIILVSIKKDLVGDIIYIIEEADLSYKYQGCYPLAFA